MTNNFLPKKKYLAGAFLATFFCASAVAAMNSDDQQAIKSLHDQVGKYPLDTHFFQNEIIKKRLAAILPLHEQDLIKKLTVETPISYMKNSSENVLTVNVCKPHDCGDTNATLYFDFSTANLLAYFVETDKSGTQMKWFTPKKACNVTEKMSASAISKESQTAATMKKINECLGK